MEKLRGMVADALDKAEWDANDDHLNNDRDYALMRADAILKSLGTFGEIFSLEEMRDMGFELVRVSEQLRKAESGLAVMRAALVQAKREMWWIGARDAWTLDDFKNWAVIQQIDAALSPTPNGQAEG